VEKMNNPFINEIVASCREKVRNSHSMSFDLEEECYRGIVYEPNGFYHLYYLEKGMENIAKFICSSDKDKLITDIDDYAVLNTMGCFIDICITSLPLETFIPILEVYQLKNSYISFKYK